MSRSFYVTTPIYYVNDAPHIGHAYTTVHADVLARWRRLHGDDVLFLTGTDEHGLKIQRAAEERGVTAAGVDGHSRARGSATPGRSLDISNDDFIRTTEDRHRVAVQAFLQRVYDNGFIELATYEGLYCVACEAYYTEDELVDGPVPDPPSTGRARSPRRTTSSSSPSSSSRCSTTTRPIPRRCSPTASATRSSGFIRQGLRDFSMSRTSISWGIPLPWDPAHVTYVWYDALINYVTAVGLRRRSGAVRRTAGRCSTTSSPRTSCGSTRSTGRRC